MSKTMRITVQFGDLKEHENSYIVFNPSKLKTIVDVTATTGDKLTDDFTSTFLCDRGRAAVKEALIQEGEIQ